jgi:hypothetical protein
MRNAYKSLVGRLKSLIGISVHRRKNSIKERKYEDMDWISSVEDKVGSCERDNKLPGLK